MIELLCPRKGKGGGLGEAGGGSQALPRVEPTRLRGKMSPAGRLGQ